MAHINIDMNQVEDTGGEPHTEGMHAFEIHKATLEDNKSGGGQHIRWQLKPIASEVSKRHVFLRTSLKADALWNLKGFLKDGLGQAEFDPSGFDLDNYVGMKVQVNCKVTEYNGEPTNEVTRPYKKYVE